MYSYKNKKRNIKIIRVCVWVHVYAFMRMFVCGCAHMSVFLFVFVGTYVCVFAYSFICVYARACVPVLVLVALRMYVYARTCVHAWVCICVHVSVCICVCEYVSVFRACVRPCMFFISSGSRPSICMGVNIVYICFNYNFGQNEMKFNFLGQTKYWIERCCQITVEHVW